MKQKKVFSNTKHLKNTIFSYYLFKNQIIGFSWFSKIQFLLKNFPKNIKKTAFLVPFFFSKKYPKSLIPPKSMPKLR